MIYTIKDAYSSIIQKGYLQLSIDHNGKTYDIDIVAETIDGGTTTFTFKNETNKRIALEIGFILDKKTTKKLDSVWYYINAPWF